MPPSHKVTKAKTKDVSVDALASFDILQPKEDGWYVECVPVGGTLYVFSSTSTLVAQLPWPADLKLDTYLCGEYIFGTSRAKQQNFRRYETITLFDVNAPGTYHARYCLLQQIIWHYHAWCDRAGNPRRIFLIPALNPLDSLSYLMDEVIAQRTEGVIGRMWDAGFGSKVHRHKLHVTVDYVLMQLTPGTGKYEGATGAFVGGAYRDGKLTRMCKVSGMSDRLRIDTWQRPDKYIGRVFEAEGAQLFESGALRHPRFKRWRTDVTPIQVLADQEARYVR